MGRDNRDRGFDIDRTRPNADAARHLTHITDNGATMTTPVRVYAHELEDADVQRSLEYAQRNLKAEFETENLSGVHPGGDTIVEVRIIPLIHREHADSGSFFARQVLPSGIPTPHLRHIADHLVRQLMISVNEGSEIAMLRQRVAQLEELNATPDTTNS